MKDARDIPGVGKPGVALAGVPRMCRKRELSQSKANTALENPICGSRVPGCQGGQGCLRKSTAQSPKRTVMVPFTQFTGLRGHTAQSPWRPCSHSTLTVHVHPPLVTCTASSQHEGRVWIKVMCSPGDQVRHSAAQLVPEATGRRKQATARAPLGRCFCTF